MPISDYPHLLHIILDIRVLCLHSVRKNKRTFPIFQIVLSGKMRSVLEANRNSKRPPLVYFNDLMQKYSLNLNILEERELPYFLGVFYFSPYFFLRRAPKRAFHIQAYIN